jgi:putative flippase GtrA
MSEQLTRPAWRHHLRTHPVPRYLVTGLASGIIDLGLLRLLHGTLHWNLVLSTVLSYLSAFTANFALSRQWTFAHGRHARVDQQLIRYLVLVAINLAVTVGIVSGLVALGTNYLIARLIAMAIVAVGNFFAYRHWVFR